VLDSTTWRHTPSAQDRGKVVVVLLVVGSGWVVVVLVVVGATYSSHATCPPCLHSWMSCRLHRRRLPPAPTHLRMAGLQTRLHGAALARDGGMRSATSASSPATVVSLCIGV